MPPEFVPSHLYTTAETRELDRLAIEEGGLPGIVLMKRAGRAAWQLLRERWPDARSITVVSGGGNNGGDGYIVAGLAAEQGFAVRLIAAGDPAQLRGDAASARDFAFTAGVVVESFGAPLQGDVIVDALLGTGVKGEVRPHYAALIEAINNSGRPVLALDVPSGLCSDTGRACGSAVRADATLTFIGVKRGLCTAAGIVYRGDLSIADLGVPGWVYERVPAHARRLSLASLLQALPPRPRDAHKGHYGHLLVVGGDHGYGGAVALAAEGALRTGVGLISVATRPEHVAPLLARHAELMVRGVAGGAELEPLLRQASAVVVGPGLGQCGWSEQLLHRVLAARKPTLIDADGLNLLARSGCGLPERIEGIPLVITPHPGEAARLLECTIEEVQMDRFASALRLSQRYKAEALLKGAGSVMASVDQPVVDLCSYGNPGMASGGMGDVLSGIVGALLAQGLLPSTALRLGVCLHGAAADIAAGQHGEAGLVAADLMTPLRQLINRREQSVEVSPWKR